MKNLIQFSIISMITSKTVRKIYIILEDKKVYISPNLPLSVHWKTENQICDPIYKENGTFFFFRYILFFFKHQLTQSKLNFYFKHILYHNFIGSSAKWYVLFQIQYYFFLTQNFSITIWLFLPPNYILIF